MSKKIVRPAHHPLGSLPKGFKLVRRFRKPTAKQEAVQQEWEHQRWLDNPYIEPDEHDYRPRGG